MNKQLRKIINSYCETGSNMLLRQIEDYCNNHGLFFEEDEKFIMIEDDVFYTNF